MGCPAVATGTLQRDPREHQCLRQAASHAVGNTKTGNEPLHLHVSNLTVDQAVSQSGLVAQQLGHACDA